MPQKRHKPEEIVAKRSHSSLGYRPPAPEVSQWPAKPSGASPPATPALASRPVMHQDGNRTTRSGKATRLPPDDDDILGLAIQYHGCRNSVDRQNAGIASVDRRAAHISAFGWSRVGHRTTGSRALVVTG